ncbi:93d22a61-0b8f-44d1-9983-b19f5425a72c [Thermothielavioides terrestris]|uniref:93d22a61-0b8f-44d1-9983-b19f5425a72c n=1 Tax=Thermothielavioides terrestris TaxID=2587410 RepID=A0A3S4F5Y9_9PEZI|nr:93d22a61-0b8f-44d1-9983-b19f5425a72c [Thermothielavioides terrestris]
MARLVFDGGSSSSGSASDSDYGEDLTLSEAELLMAAFAERFAPVSPLSRPAPTTPAPRPSGSTPAPARNTQTPSPISPILDPDASQAVEETIAALSDDDLTSDVSELQKDAVPSGRQGDPHKHELPRGGLADEKQNRKLAPSVSGHDGDLGSFVSKTKARSIPTLLPGPDVIYPDLSRALSDAQAADISIAPANEQAGVATEDNRPPLLRFRTFPMKPLSVSDLTAGSWCELQYFYTLTRLPGGRKTRTAAMKRGSAVHERLEREVFTPVNIEVAKKEDTFGLKIWNIIQGLRVLRDEGFTRELEVWGMVDGNVVNGVIDSLSYENPDPELQEDVLSSRGSSQTVTNSQPYEPSAAEDYEIYITDVKTRNSTTPPPKAQVRVALIQLFLYHRFLSEMASDKLDYIRVFERYGLNLDEPFSDAFMAQIGAIHDEVFVETQLNADAFDAGSTTDASSNADFVSAPSSPSQSPAVFPDSSQNLRYRTLRALLPLLRAELRLTFPRGAADLGQIVAVEYRYRGRDPPPPANSELSNNHDDGASASASASAAVPPPPPLPRYVPGSVICVNTFFVEPETLDLYLADTMRWWKGERAPRGVALDEAPLKCRSCEFADECEWRLGLEQEALLKARRRREMEMKIEGETRGKWR